MPKKTQHIAIIIDSWFPGHKRVGRVGGIQVRVKEITKSISRTHPAKFSLFFPGYDNLIYRFFWPLIVYFRVIQLHRKHPLVLIHAHGPQSSIITAILGRTIHLPTVQTVHGTHLMDLKQKSYRTWIQRWVSTKIKFSAIISVSTTFLKYPNRNEYIRVIQNGVEVSHFDAVTVDKHPEPTLIWVGHYHMSKGINILRQAIAKVRRRIPNVQAKLISGGEITGRALVREYKQSHVFVLPSLAEAQPIALLEAWAAKLPVIATAVGDNSTMVKHGINGYLVEPGNVSQLADAIIKMVRARNRDRKMGEAGYQMVKQHYTWDKAATATWQVYQKVLSL